MTDNEIALLIAIKEGNFIQVENLIKSKVKLNFADNTKDRFGWTPLKLAIFHDRIDILKLLLENGAKVNLLLRYDDRSVLDFARRHGKFEDRPKVEEFLLSYGAKTRIEIIKENRFTLVNFVQNEKGNFIETEGKSFTFQNLDDFYSWFYQEKGINDKDRGNISFGLERYGEYNNLWMVKEIIPYQIIIEKVGYFEHDEPLLNSVTKLISVMIPV